MLLDAGQPSTTRFAITVAATLGAALGSAIVGAFLKWRFDGKLDHERSLHARALALFGDQVAALLAIHSGLTQLQEALASWNLHLRHGISQSSDQETVQRLRDEVKKKYRSAQLILPSNIAADIERFFTAELWVSRDLGYATLAEIARRNLPPDQDAGAPDYDAIDKVIYGELYPMLRAIEERARGLMHASDRTEENLNRGRS